jgi:predicted nucleic acid-binding protein
MSSKSVEPTKYTLDTNLFLEAFRNDDAAAALDAFLRRALATTFLSSVVVQELRAGARTRKDAMTLQRSVFGPFERRRRVVGPSAAGFKQSGRILADLAARHVCRCRSWESLAGQRRAARRVVPRAGTHPRLE